MVTLDTVKEHVTPILGKLGAANRTEAVARVRELGLIPYALLSSLGGTFVLPADRERFPCPVHFRVTPAASPLHTVLV